MCDAQLLPQLLAWSRLEKAIVACTAAGNYPERERLSLNDRSETYYDTLTRQLVFRYQRLHTHDGQALQTTASDGDAGTSKITAQWNTTQ